MINQNDKGKYAPGFESWLPCQGGPDGITNVGKETILFVADSCPRTNSKGNGPLSCYSVSDMDASVEGYRALTGCELEDRLQATYTFVECPEEYVKGPTKIRFNTNAIEWNTEVIPIDFRFQIVKITVRFGASSKKYELAHDNR